jgi:hypothetical protein
VSHARFTPRVRVASGERISISVVVRRPGWESWALGGERRETLTVQTPVAKVTNRWVRAARGAHAEVRFDRPVERISVAGAAVSGRRVTLPTKTPAGSLVVRSAARPWERLGGPVRVTWFPKADRPVVLVSRRAEWPRRPSLPDQAHLLRACLAGVGQRRATVVPSVTGDWTTTDSHTLLFRPSGAGAPFNSDLKVRFPSALLVADATGADPAPTKTLRLSIAPASVPASAAAPCAGGVPPGRLDAGERRCAAHDAERGLRRRRPTRRTLHVALSGHPARAAGPLAERRAEHDHSRRRDDVPGRPPTRRRRHRR